MNRGKIDCRFKIQDSSFGLSLNCREMLPNWAEQMLVTVYKTSTKTEQQVLLPHQLYFDKLMEISENGKYQVTIEPHMKDDLKIPLFSELLEGT